MSPPLEESSAVRLRALRGATTVQDNTAEAILEATDELLRALIERNALDADDMVSCIFTCTQDLTAEYPAVAARALGFNAVPLLCTQEMAVPGSMARVVRLLMHFYAEPQHEVRHVYRGEARRLRLDIAGAQ